MQKRIINNNDCLDYAMKWKPLVDTGRKAIPLMKFPQDLDFTKIVGGTTYVVKSHFKAKPAESLLTIVSRLYFDGKSLEE